MAVSKRGNKWQARVNEPNVKYHRYSFTTEASAIQWEREARAAIARGDTVDSPSEDMSDLPLSEYFDKAAHALWSDPSKPKQGINAVVRAAGDTPIAAITQDYVETFIERSRDTYSPLTINIRLSMLRMVHRHAKKKGHNANSIEFERLSEKDCVGRLKFLDERLYRILCSGAFCLRHWEAVFEHDCELASDFMPFSDGALPLGRGSIECQINQL